MHQENEANLRMGQMSDEHLLELAAQGNGNSFGILVERWEHRIFRFICRYVGNIEEAQDLTQDTFSKAFQNLSKLSDPARFSSWLYTIALNECRMRFRRSHRHNHVSLEDVQVDRESSRLQKADTPEDSVVRNEGVQRLRKAFGRLPSEQREVILMKEYEGLRFHEISEVLSIPLSTAKSRMYLGLKTLRKILEEDHEL
jgi:RNA polymerase sigma-70 factor (ECF subfamily)